MSTSGLLDDSVDEVVLKGGTISVFTRDGRLLVDDQPTCEAEMLRIVERLLAEVAWR